MTRTRFHARNFAAAVLAVLLAACNKEPSKEATTTLRVFVQPLISHAPALVADAEGYFAEQGIKVEFVRMSDPAAAIPLLINGSIDVLGGGASPGLLNAITRGVPIRAVADKGYYRAGGCSRSGLVLRSGLAKEKASGRANVRRISIDKQPTMQYVVEKMLASVGFNLKDLEVLYIPHLPEIDAIGKGKIDAALVGDPYMTAMIDRGAAVQWVRQEDVFPNVQLSFVFFGPNLLQKNPDAGRRFLIAHLKAVRQLEEGKTQRNLDVLERVTEEGADALRRMCWPAYYPDGHVDFSSVADFQEWALERKLIDRSATAEEFWEPKLVTQANAALAKEEKHQ